MGDYDGDVMSVITFEREEDRERLYQVLGPKRRIIDTRLIKWNSIIEKEH